jgi:YVTN family beta-propeller protein
VEFRILGPLEVEADGRLLGLGATKQRALLALLVLEANRVVPRERLIEALWGERAPRTARTALHGYVSGLRKVLGTERIETRPPGYLLHAAPDELDLTRFEDLLAQARNADPPAAAALQREALGLWRGVPLADLGPIPYARTELLRFEELRLGAIEERIENDLRLGHDAQLVHELEGLVRDHPLRERLRGQLMLALYRSGRQAESLEVYRQGRRRLSDELGLEPGEELRALERAILAQDPALTVSPPPGPTVGRRGVPTGTVTFLFTDVERSTELLRTLGAERYQVLLQEHAQVLRAAAEEAGGREIDTQGDSFFFAFPRARDAVLAAIAAQRNLIAREWPDDVDVRVRIGLDTGEPTIGADRYVGLGVHRAARIMALGNGGQVLLSDTTRNLVQDDLPPGVSLNDLGEQPLKDIERPVRLYQLLAPGLPDAFSPLRTGPEPEAPGRRPSRRGVLALLAGLVAIGAAAGIVVALIASGSSRVLAAPNSVAVIDPATNRVVSSVPVGDTPTAVALSAGTIWVLNANGETVSKINARTGTVLATFPAGTSPIDLAFGDGSLWVTTSSFRLLRIDPDSKIATSIRLPGSPNPLQGASASWVAASGQNVWATGNATASQVAPRRVLVAIPNVNCCGGIAIGGGRVWIADETGLRALDAETGRTVLHVPLGFAGGRVAFGKPYVWVAEPHGQQVWAIDPRTGRLSGSVSVGTDPDGITIDEGVVWVASAGGTVSRIDPTTLRVVDTIRVGGTPAGIAAGNGAVWVAVD